MKAWGRRFALGILVAAALPPALAQIGPGGGGPGPGGGIVGRPNASGQGINYAPQPAVYAVLSVDADARTVQLRAADGRTGFVQVGESVYDLGKIKAGDKIKVDFIVPDEKNPQLRAASIWPAD